MGSGNENSLESGPWEINNCGHLGIRCGVLELWSAHNDREMRDGMEELGKCFRWGSRAKILLGAVQASEAPPWYLV